MPCFRAVLLPQCYDGSEAVDIIREQGSSVDVVFLDSQMTHVHGPEAAAAIRSLGYTGLIVAVSGNVLDEDVLHFKRSGANSFISKPLDLSKIQDVLASKSDCSSEGCAMPCVVLWCVFSRS